MREAAEKPSPNWHSSFRFTCALFRSDMVRGPVPPGTLPNLSVLTLEAGKVPKDPQRRLQHPVAKHSFQAEKHQKHQQLKKNMAQALREQINWLPLQ
jgi:hypothetical protein